MAFRSPARSKVKRGALQSLRSDTRGNTLALMAAAVVPLVGMVGGALDMSRLYLVKTRVQQACDAGALAGRKRMGGGQWSQSSNAPQTAALNFFDSNFADGAYGTSARTRAFTESAGKVTGVATVTVPMTLMRIFGNTNEQIRVTCDAEMRLPNTDVMFVLDTTGSMGQKAISTDTQTKIVALKSAVKCFYEIVAKVDTTETCATGTPSGGTGTSTQVRFGFVPYATNVNVGRLLPTSYLANSWPYQSREAVMKTASVNVDTPTTPTQSGPPARANIARGTAVVTATYSGVTSDANCQAKAPIQGYTNEQSTGPESAPYNQQASGSPATRTHQTSQPYNGRENGALWDSGSKICYVGYYPATYNLIRTYAATDARTTTVRQVFDYWRYAQVNVDISGLKNGTAWNASFLRPIGDTSDGAQTITNKTINWDGCIEERQTIRASSYTSATGGAAKDLDIDTVPSSGNTGSMWGPALHDLIYVRNSTASNLDGNAVPGFSMAESLVETNYTKIDGNDSDSYFCPTEAKKLQGWPTATGFEAYVNGLTVNGNTYHDIGLIWGARFLSPTGIFASENALTPLGAEIERHLIFMTDGETCTASYNYGPYGFPWFDRRTTPFSDVPSYGCETETTTGGTLSVQVNSRATAVCTAVKNKNITLWVIWFGASKPNLETRLTNCATNSRFYAARNSADLQTTFAAIANQISQLRLTN